MGVVKTVGLILAVICLLTGSVQLYRFKKEFQNLDEDQVITDELANKWVKRLYWVTFSIVLGSILSIVATVLPYLK